MPLHDWTRVNSGLFHHFHQGWCWQISVSLNRGPLPEGYTALVEQRSGSKESDVLAIEERYPDVDPTGDGGGIAVRERPRAKFVKRSEKEYYADKASRVVIRHRLGRVVAFIEIVSPGNKHDEISINEFSDKIVEAIRARVHVLVVDLFPPSRRFASYEADGVNTAFIETLAVGEALPAMPLFIAPGTHVLVPLEETYTQAWADSPKAVRRLVE